MATTTVPQPPPERGTGAGASASAAPAENGAVEPDSQPSGQSATQVGWLQALKEKLGFDAAKDLRGTLEETLQSEGGAGSEFTAPERDMLLRILRYGGLRVDDVMVPRVDIIAIEQSEPISELLKLFAESEVSRIPVYHDTLDDPRGMIHIKDLMMWMTRAAAVPAGAGRTQGKNGEAGSASGSLDLSAVDLSQPISSARLNRPVLFVPSSMPVVNLLLRMQSTRAHLALVVDEHGGTDGLVSIEDLVEQIVGDIEDEHDEDDRHIVEDPKYGLVAAARTPIEELEAHLGVKLADEETIDEISTLGGLVFSLLGRVPLRGELIKHPTGLEFEVLDADPRRLKKLRVLVPKTAAR
jgi:CBS domain containing-hemolysin-like protein